MEILENDLAPDMRFQETEGIRSRFYEKSAAGPFKVESRRKNADIRKGDTGTGRKKREKRKIQKRQGIQEKRKRRK